MAAVGPNETRSWVPSSSPVCPQPARRSGASRQPLRSGAAPAAAAPRTASAALSISLGTGETRQQGVMSSPHEDTETQSCPSLGTEIRFPVCLSQTTGPWRPLWPWRRGGSKWTL